MGLTLSGVSILNFSELRCRFIQLRSSIGLHLLLGFGPFLLHSLNKCMECLHHIAVPEGMYIACYYYYWQSGQNWSVLEREGVVFVDDSYHLGAGPYIYSQ